MSECNLVIVKTELGAERIAASRIRDLDPLAKVEAAPRGLRGMVLVEPGGLSKDELARLIEERVPEAGRVIQVDACVKAELDEMARVAAELAKTRISASETFAVRTTRRGRHPYTSIDVNVVVGDAVRKATGATVNLTRPDKVVLVEIIQDEALIAIVPGSLFHRKMGPGKYPLYKLYRKISLVQMPYLGPLDACRNMGVRIGREVQNFEVAELVIAPDGPVDALQLKTFIEGVLEGIESRYEVQRKSYGREARRVPVLVQDIYQLVRERHGREPIIVLEPEGEPVTRAAWKLYEMFRNARRVSVLVGSRRGIPLGIYRFADLVIDIAPGITLSTDYAAAAALIAIGTVVHDLFARENQHS
ncbi:THUMP domain-containing protein [Pyrolobus fumarii 1A]|uniref:THUMP domain-containing protein n=1 Tax=Pyrolobus fumarii (strain DSM 11204 / 1A) TaxID=694429 RepID=G0EGB5_PYRF1|nr:SPOUT family RNA methylase [Pyrolobus fumarii]AEM39140.1 THUMP domain-containing protein [Pyrolobus fumarii 1A]